MSQRVQTYQEAEDLLHNRINYERLSAGMYSHQDFKLARMKRLLDALGNPERNLPVIHIAGTKGKGSTSVMIAQVLMTAGYCTGLFTSPHVSRFDERLQVDRQSPTETEFVELVNRLFTVVDELIADSPEHTPTFFELTTALGWLFFQQRECDFVVLEVGLGGRLDSTNLCHPLVTVITNISYDHTHLLGNTLEEIAAEKGGIIKPGIPVVTGVEQPETKRVIETIAQTNEAPLFLLGREFSQESCRNGLKVRTPEQQFSDLKVALSGEHQRKNAALAIMVFELLQQQGISISTEAIKRGLAEVRWPIRIEIVQTEPLVILDAAHNEASMRALVETLANEYPEKKKILIFGCTRDKDIQGMLKLVLPAFDEIIITQYQTNPRAVSATDLLQQAGVLTSKKLQIFTTPATAWKVAEEQAGKDDLICITGSFFLAAEMRDLLQSHSTSAH